MSEQVYSWKRFWCPRSSRISLGDRSYLSDADTERGRADNPNLKSFAEISSLPCLVLLGEPGIGKTQTMKTEQERISHQIKANGDEELTLYLRSFGSEDRLVKKLFKIQKFTTWVEGTHRLYIFPEKAKHAEADYLQYQNCLKPPEPEPLLAPQPKQRVLEVLEIIEAGQPQLWWQVCMAMTLIPTSTHWHFFKEPDLTQLPGWQEAEADTKERITKTAKVYLEAAQLETNTLLEIDNFSCDAFAGYQAMYLLLKQEPEFIPTIPTHIWSKWILVILRSASFCFQDNPEKDEYCG